MSTSEATPATPTTPAAPPPAATPAPAAAVEKPTKPAEGAAPAEPKKATADDFARFSEKERKWEQERLAHKEARDKLAKIEKELADARAAGNPIDTLKTRAKSEALAVLAELGLDYETVTKAALAARKKDPAADMRKLVDEALAEDRKKRETETKAESERQFNEAWARIDTQFDELVKGGGEAYELLRIELEEHPETVRRTLREIDEIDRVQRALPPEKRLKGYQPISGLDDAARRYEDLLIQQVERRASASKIKARLNPTPPAQQDQSAPQNTATGESGPKASAGGPRTLTQAHAQTRAVPAPAVSRPEDTPKDLSPTERIRLEQEQERQRLADAVAVLNGRKSA